MKRLRFLAKLFGPGLISGASDDDPSGIGTYVQGGAQFGLGLSWLALFQFPLMVVIQEMCGRIGLTTGSGIVGAMRKKYSVKFAIPMVLLLATANVITIGADIGAMGSSIHIIFPSLPASLTTAGFAVFIVLTVVFFPYHKYARMLKFTVLALFAYVITAFLVGANWSAVAFSTLVPHFELNRGFLMMFLAFFGATFSPYVFFWQASEEVEEDISKKKIDEIGQRSHRVTRKEIRLMRADSILGMAFSQIIMWFIIVVTASTLHANSVFEIQTVDQAAMALKPLVNGLPNAGKIAELLFATGIVGTGLLAVPVMASSSAYAMSDGFGWKQGLNKKFREAKTFYMVIIGSIVLGLWINFSQLDPIKALVYASVISGILAVPLLVIILRISNDRRILGSKTNGPISNLLGWLTVGVMCIAAIATFAIFFLHGMTR